MSDDNRILSLDAYRKRNAAAKGEKPAPKGQRAEGQSAEGSGEFNSADPQIAEAETTKELPLPGVLYWLHCSVCKTFEYTELAVAGGRVHQRCGTRVEERAVEIDLRGEQTLVEMNLRQIKRLEEYLAAQREKQMTYAHRLSLIAKGPVKAYGQNDLATLPIAEIDPMGLLISHALAKPEQHFSPAPAPPSGTPTKDPS